MTQSMFDLPRPKRKEYSVVVREVTSDEYCLQPVTIMDEYDQVLSHQTCYNDHLEIWDCECCGVPTCQECFSEEAIDGWSICESCAQMSKEDREKVRAFRLSLNEV